VTDGQKDGQTPHNGIGGMAKIFRTCNFDLFYFVPTQLLLFSRPVEMASEVLFLVAQVCLSACLIVGTDITGNG